MKGLRLFALFCKMIGHILFTCRHYRHSDRSNQQVKSKQHYVSKSNLGAREENVIEVVNIVNIVVVVTLKYLLEEVMLLLLIMALIKKIV